MPNPTEADLKRWKDAVIESCIINWTLTAENENDPRKALNDLMCWHQTVALDPRVSEEAAKLRDTYKPEVDRLRAENRKLREEAEKWDKVAEPLREAIRESEQRL